MNCSKAALSCLRVKSLQYEFGQITKMANFKYREMILPYGNMVILGSLTILLPKLCIVSAYLNTTNRHAGDMHTNSLNIMTGVCSSAAI